MSVVLIVVLLATARTAGKTYGTSAPEGAGAGDLRLEPCTFRQGRHLFRAECGTLVVPENRLSPGSRLRALPVVRIPAKGTDPGVPVFVLNGGPGSSNLRFIPQNWLRSHDLVLVGYRGVDGQIVLDCPEINEVLRSNDEDLLAENALRAAGQAAGRCADRLQAEGVDLAGYRMPDVIADLETVRQKLGYSASPWWA